MVNILPGALQREAGISYLSRVSCQKGPICHALAWRVGPFWQDSIDIIMLSFKNFVWKYLQVELMNP